MSDKPYYHEEGQGALRGWVLTKMLSGAGYAALFLTAIGFLIWAIYGIGQLLPEDSKTAPDPILRGALDAPAVIATA